MRALEPTICAQCGDLDASHCLCAVAVSGPRAFYNERDPFAAQWLRNLIARGLIAPGVVDERSITEISPDDLRGFTQCHFFAGIGVWSHALRRAGWPDDVPVWTGSCPCQPFSAAGKQQRFDDDRHLWPVWFDLIRECRPAIVLGEQVASALDWLDLVSADLEGEDYAFGSSDLCAAGFQGAHIRQRLYFVGVADADDARLEGRGRVPERSDQRAARADGLADWLADADGRNTSAQREQRGRQHGREPQDGSAVPDAVCDQGEIDPRWAHVDWLLCRNPAGEPSWRPVESGAFPLAHGVAGRMGRVRAYGNALDAETAAQFCGAVAETLTGARQHAAVLASGAGEMTFHGEHL